MNISCRFSRLVNFLKISKRCIIRSYLPNLEVNKITLADYVLQQCDKFSNNIALIDDSRNINYKYLDLKQAIHSIASGLTKRNVKHGTMVGIIAQNCPEYLMIIYALTGMGCCVTICNQNFTEFEMTYQVTDSQPSIIFTDKANLSKVQKVASKVDSVKEIFVIGTDEDIEGCSSLNKLLKDRGDMSPIGSVNIDVDNDIALMPYSSGTTGLPKGVMLSNSNIVINKEQTKEAHKLDSRHVMLMALPLYHIYATVIIPGQGFYNGSTIVVQPKFDPDKYLQAIEKYKVSYLHLVPPQVLFFLNYPKVKQTDISSLQASFSAAAPLDKVTEHSFCDIFKKYHPDFDIYQGYGLTETSPITHINPFQSNKTKKQGSVGLVLPNMECKVVDITTRNEVGPDTPGELLLKGPNIMKGYFGKSGSTQSAFEDGWFKTGDICSYDSDDYFYICDRIKELIKVKGYQVAPAEIEGVLLTYPGIADCAVIGVNNERYGEVPKAYIVTSSDKNVDKEDVYKYLEEMLSDHKQLRGGIEFVNEIPKSPSGKILRRVLRESLK